MSQLKPYDFGGACFDLDAPRDREILRFILSQALYGEATGVYCGKSLYAAASLEAAQFYARQARQELQHLILFAEIFRMLGLEPAPGHWIVKLFSSHNHYYPLKVLMEHAIGEGLVLDIFKDVLLQTLPDSDPRVPPIKKKLYAICREEEEHVAWGEKETRRILAAQPWLATPFYGLLEAQIALLPFIANALIEKGEEHPVLSQLPGFLEHTQKRVWQQGQELGFAPAERPGPMRRAAAISAGVALFARSQFARSHSRLDKTYLSELGFGTSSRGS